MKRDWPSSHQPIGPSLGSRPGQLRLAAVDRIDVSLLVGADRRNAFSIRRNREKTAIYNLRRDRTGFAAIHILNEQAFALTRRAAGKDEHFPSGVQCAMERLLLSCVIALDSPAPIGRSVNCTRGFGAPRKTNFLSGESAKPNPSVKRIAQTRFSVNLGFSF